MLDVHLRLFTPLIELHDSLDSARRTAEYASASHLLGKWPKFWLERSAWHLANAIGWASRD